MIYTKKEIKFLKEKYPRYGPKYLIYTKKEVKFLKENYPRYGPKYCSIILGRKMDCVMAKAYRENLLYNKKEKHDSLRPVSFEQFININSELAYFLGFFWADGFIKNYTSGKITYWRIVLEISKKDAVDIFNLMKRIGKWSVQKRKRKRNKTSKFKESWGFVTNNKPLFLFLKQNDYVKKSNAEPTKILAKVPIKYHVDFWRGYFDGDGCCSFMGNSGKAISFYSTYKYKWIEIIKLCKKLKLNNYKIYRNKQKNNQGSRSALTLYGKKSEPMAKYLLMSKLGLKRKTIKLKKFITKK